MGDVRETFSILEDGSLVGAPCTKTVEGDSATGKVGPTVFGFKDNSGNVILPQLDYLGRLPVTQDSAGTPKRARGSQAGTTSLVSVASISLTVNKKYSNYKMVVSCRKGALFQLIQSDNAVETILDEVIVDSGQYTFELDARSDVLTAGATGAQLLLIKGKNFDGSGSDLHATVMCVETT